MNRVVVIGLVCVLAFTQSSWGKNAQSENIAGGLCDIVIDIVTAPCYLLAACLGMDNQPCLTPQKKLVTCVPAKTVSHSPNQSASQKKIPTASPPASPRTVRQMQSETPRAGEADTPHSAPPVKIEKFIPQDKQLSPEPLPREVRLPEPTLPPAPSFPQPPAVTKSVPPEELPREVRLPEPTPPAPPSVPQPPAVTKSVPPEELLTVPSKQEILEKIHGSDPRTSSTEVTQQQSTVKMVEPAPIADVKTDKSKPEKKSKSGYKSPCMPVYPMSPCMPGYYFR